MERKEFVEKINHSLAGIFGSDLEIKYRPVTDTVSADLEPTLREIFAKTQRLEIAQRRTLTGPQRDSYEFLVKGKKLSLFSSGEKKKYLLMLYIAFMELFRQEKNDYPVLLVDDYDSALDERNLEFLFDHYPQVQIIATSVNRSEKFDHFIRLGKEN